MNFWYYTNYITIVEEGTLTAAAKKLHTAQPALSNQIKALEDTYGARLFHRGSGSRRLELTEAGRVLYEKAQIIVNAENEARREIALTTASSADSLRIGVEKALNVRDRLRALEVFAERYPDEKIHLHEGDETELIRMLQSGMIDAAMFRTERTDDAGFELLFRRQDSLIAAYREGAFFMGNDREEVGLYELSKFPLCVPEEYVPVLRTAFREVGCTFTPRFVGTTINMCVRWAQAGKGVALVPGFLVSMLYPGTVRHKRISGKPLGSASVVFLMQKKESRSRAVNDFLEICQELYGGIPDA